MTRITSSDQVLLLLRSHLQRMRRRSGAATAKAPAKRGSVERLQTLAVEGPSDTEIARAVVAGLLEDEFGASVANDTKFQVMVEEVRQLLERDDAGRQLLQRAVATLTRR